MVSAPATTVSVCQQLATAIALRQDFLTAACNSNYQPEDKIF
jgi:hypothetical protein